MSDDNKLPKDLEDVSKGSVDEAFRLYDEVVALAEAHAGVEPDKSHVGLILQPVFVKLAERFINEDRWSVGTHANALSGAVERSFCDLTSAQQVR